MTTEESSSCPICLESLFVPTIVTTEGTSLSSQAQPQLHSIGSTVPCGHCLHVHCWDEWMAASMRRPPSFSSLSRYNPDQHHNTKCPLCNSTTTGFVRLFLNIPPTSHAMMGNDKENEDDIDDISIETDDEDENEEDESVSKNDRNEDQATNDIVNVDDNEKFIEDRKMPFQTNTQNHHRNDAPPIINLLCDDDEDDKEEHHYIRSASINHHPNHPEIPPMMMMVTIDDDDDDENTDRTTNVATTSHGTKHHNMKMKTSNNSNNKNSSKKTTQKSLKKYRRMIRKLQEQKKVLQTQYQKYLDQCRTIQTTLSIKDGEYAELAVKYNTLEEKEHNTQLRMDHIMLEKIRLHNQIETLQYRLDEETTLVQTKNNEIQNMQLQHAKQMKALKNKKHCNMSEVQTILQERPKLLEQLRNLKELVQHLQHQLRTSNLSHVLQSQPPPIPIPNQPHSNNIMTMTTTSTAFATTTSATHKQRKQLLRTISEGMDGPCSDTNKLSQQQLRQQKTNSMTKDIRPPLIRLPHPVSQSIPPAPPTKPKKRRTKLEEMEEDDDDADADSSVIQSLPMHKPKRMRLPSIESSSSAFYGNGKLASRSTTTFRVGFYGTNLESREPHPPPHSSSSSSSTAVAVAPTKMVRPDATKVGGMNHSRWSLDGVGDSQIRSLHSVPTTSTTNIHRTSLVDVTNNNNNNNNNNSNSNTAQPPAPVKKRQTTISFYKRSNMNE